MRQLLGGTTGAPPHVFGAAGIIVQGRNRCSGITPAPSRRGRRRGALKGMSATGASLRTVDGLVLLRLLLLFP